MAVLSLQEVVASVLLGVGDNKHLQREKGINALRECFKSEYASSPEFQDLLQQGVHDLLASDTWERKLGGLLAAKDMVEQQQFPAFETILMEECMRLLEDGEVRVRMAVADCLFALAKKLGITVWEACSTRILGSIQENFDRDNVEGRAEPSTTAATEGSSPAAAAGPTTAEPRPNLISALLQSTYKPQRIGAGELRHGTEGWKCLETSMKALRSLVEGTGDAIRPLLDAPLRELLYKTLHHPNRFVRETGHFTVASICQALSGAELAAIGAELAPRLRDGLSDNWSQVRYAACVATRTFMSCVGQDHISEFDAVLVPPMCLNRYYVAEGVRLYAQQSWKDVVGTRGRELVALHIDQVVEYYIMQSKANNHAVREAACACIAEMVEKVDRAAVAPHVPKLVRALLMCFKDMSWPVRDAACTACGRFVLAYPEESRIVIEELYSLWFAHLWDNIPTVRENSAMALANCVKAYQAEALQRVLPVLRELLPRARDQPAESSKYSELEPTSRFGVAQRKVRDQDPEVHTDQDMFSCGSLSARFSTSYLIKSDGCMDHGFARGKQPWEASDGALFLMRELSGVAPEAVPEFFPLLAELARIASFQHAFHLHETLWRALPVIATNLGKPRFKPHLEQFLDPMFADLSCGHQLAEVAAGKCIAAVRAMLGERILEGRLNPEQLQLLRSSPQIPLASAAGAAPKDRAVDRTVGLQ